jgi:hypothetical protein
MGIIFTKIFIVFEDVGFLSLDKTQFFDKLKHQRKFSR